MAFGEKRKEPVWEDDGMECHARVKIPLGEELHAVGGVVEEIGAIRMWQHLPSQGESADVPFLNFGGRDVMSAL